MDSEQAEFNQGYAILSKLKSNCLLEKGKSIGYVKLHDLLRDMTLCIMRERPRFLVRADMQLKELPHVQEWTEDLENVSLMSNFRLKVPLQMSPPKCQRLTTLLLSGCFIENIPDCFFEQMKGLKVPDLSYNSIKELPSSISNLEALIVLLLMRLCLEKVPSFSKLKALKKLDLQGTRIKNLPHGIERLVNLNYLYVDRVDGEILSKFTCLRRLVLPKEFVKGEKIGELEKLEAFEGKFYDLNELNTFVQALHARKQELSRYIISVGPDLFPQYPGGHDKKYIKLLGCKISRNGVKFPSDLQELEFVWGIVDFPEVALFSWFIPMPNATFSSLKKISIWSCQNIKKLFSCSWVLRNLQNLEELVVWGCIHLEEIIESEPEFIEEDETANRNSNSIQFTLPKLRLLAIRNLPKLKSICGANRVMVCDSLQEIDILNCPKLQRMPLYLPQLGDSQPSPPPLRRIDISSRLWRESLEWDHPNAKSLLEPFLLHKPVPNFWPWSSVMRVGSCSFAHPQI